MLEKDHLLRNTFVAYLMKRNWDFIPDNEFLLGIARECGDEPVREWVEKNVGSPDFRETLSRTLDASWKESSQRPRPN